jgi:hypothetical protein
MAKDNILWYIWALVKKFLKSDSQVTHPALPISCYEGEEINSSVMTMMILPTLDTWKSLRGSRHSEYKL